MCMPHATQMIMRNINNNCINQGRTRYHFYALTSLARGTPKGHPGRRSAHSGSAGAEPLAKGSPERRHRMYEIGARGRSHPQKHHHRGSPHKTRNAQAKPAKHPKPKSAGASPRPRAPEADLARLTFAVAPRIAAGCGCDRARLIERRRAVRAGHLQRRLRPPHAAARALAAVRLVVGGYACGQHR